MKFHLLATLLFAALCQPALAEGSDAPNVLTTPEATFRLEATAPDEEGRLRGALAIDLAPGWKTYWIGPGEAGLPPRLDFSASRGLVGTPVVSLPVPHRTDVGGVDSTVYSQPMAIAFQAMAAEGAPRLDLSLLVGICQDVCIPVQAHLTRDLATPPRLSEVAAVRAAFAALPDEAAAPASARIVVDELLVELDPADRPGTGSAHLFVAAPAPWQFGKAQRRDTTAGKAVLAAPVLARPRAAATGPIRADILITDGEFARFFRDNPIDISRAGP